MPLEIKTSAPDPMRLVDEVHVDIPGNLIRGIIQFDTAPEAEVLAQRLDALASETPKMASALRREDRACWHPVDGFRGRDNFSVETESGPLDQARIAAATVALSVDIFDQTRPPWRFHLLTTDGSDTPQAVLLFCCHHAFADGMRSMEILRGVTDGHIAADDPDAGPDTDEHDTDEHLAPQIGWPLMALSWILSTVVWSVNTTAALLRTALSRRAGGSRHLDLRLYKIPRRRLRQIARDVDVPGEDVLHAAGAHIVARINQSQRPGLRAITLLVPLTFRRFANDGRLGNHIFPVLLKVAPDHLVPLVRRIGRKIEGSKVQFTPFGKATTLNFFKLSMFAYHKVSPRLYDKIQEAWLGRLDGAVSLVPGPVRPWTVGGVPISAIWGVLPPVGFGAVSVCMLTCGDAVHVGVLYDRSKVTPPEGLQDQIETLSW